MMQTIPLNAFGITAAVLLLLSAGFILGVMAMSLLKLRTASHQDGIFTGEQTILQWAADCGLLSQGNLLKQLGKTMEEVDKSIEAYGMVQRSKNPTQVNVLFENLKTELGDIDITLTIAHALLATDRDECYSMAAHKVVTRYERTGGAIVNGLWVKGSDL